MSNGEQTKSIIGEDIEIVGSIKCGSNIHIDGKLNGDLTCTGNAVIGASATVKGNISVETISIMGQINGNVTARDRIEMKATTRLTGDIRAKRLTVEDGVTFVGKAEVTPSGTAQRGGQDGNQKPARNDAPSPQDAEEEEGKQRGGLFNKK